jgi:hypothetical protein
METEHSILAVQAIDFQVLPSVDVPVCSVELLKMGYNLCFLIELKFKIC